MSTITPSQQIQQSYTDYINFDVNILDSDKVELKMKVEVWLKMKGSPELLIELFFTTVMVSKNGPSITGNQNNKISEASYAMNYLTANRNAISEINQQLQDGKDNTNGGGSPILVYDDINVIENFRQASAYTPDAPQILQQSSTTFKTAEAQIMKVIDAVTVGVPGINNGQPYGSFSALWAAAAKPGDQNAGPLIQDFTNGINGLFSGVSVSQNVLNTQVQYTESNLKSFYSVTAQALKTILTLISVALQLMTKGG